MEKQWCQKCKMEIDLLRPDYLSDKSNVFRCGKCNSKIFVNKQVMKRYWGI